MKKGQSGPFFILTGFSRDFDRIYVEGLLRGIVMEYVTLVVILALFEYTFFAMMTGKARMDYKVEAPATTGNEIYERYLRVQQNTIEQLIVFIPSIFMFGTYIHAVAAAIIGIIFIMGRAIYYKSYTRDPKQRGIGFGITMLSNMVLLVGSLIGLVKTFFI